MIRISELKLPLNHPEPALRDAILARLGKDQYVGPSPDTSYQFVTTNKPAPGTPRPVVVGMGPCGMFVALILAQMGFKPLVLERGKIVRERTVDTFGFWRK